MLEGSIRRVTLGETAAQRLCLRVQKVGAVVALFESLMVDDRGVGLRTTTPGSGFADSFVVHRDKTDRTTTKWAWQWGHVVSLGLNAIDFKLALLF